MGVMAEKRFNFYYVNSLDGNHTFDVSPGIAQRCHNAPMDWLKALNY